MFDSKAISHRFSIHFSLAAVQSVDAIYRCVIQTIVALQCTKHTFKTHWRCQQPFTTDILTFISSRNLEILCGDQRMWSVGWLHKGNWNPKISFCDSVAGNALGDKREGLLDIICWRKYEFQSSCRNRFPDGRLWVPPGLKWGATARDPWWTQICIWRKSSVISVNDALHYMVISVV